MKFIRAKYLKRGVDIFLLYFGKYNFYSLNLVKPMPIEASIKVTENCNSRCVTCNVWKNKFQEDPTEEKLKEVFFQLKKAGVEVIGFTGGEPLLRKDINELIKKAKEITQGQVYIVTNGILLKDKAKDLVGAGVDWVAVSLDGIGNTDEKIRGVPGHFRKVIEGIKELKRLKKDLKINIGTTILKNNISEIPELINLCKELGVGWTFNLLDKNLYFFEHIEDSELRIFDEDLVDKTIEYLYKIRKESSGIFNLDAQSIEFARDYLKNKNPHVFCVIGYLRIYIDSKLNLYSGCWALPPLGNLEKEKLKDILGSKRYKERIQKMFYLKCPRCTCGYIENCMINNLPSTIKYILFGHGKSFIKNYKNFLMSQ